jgi:hypothetical protein
MAHLSSTAQTNTSSWVEVWYGDDRIGPPTPLVQFGQEIKRDASDTRLLVLNTITLNGKYLVSPAGTYNDMWTGQETLRTIFNSDGKQFALRAGPANTVISPGEYIASGIYPRVRSIGIPADLQVTDFDYSVVLEYDDLSGANSGLVDSVENSWTWTERAEDLTVELAHSVRVKGRNTATSGDTNNAYINAQSYASTLLGITNAPANFPHFAFKSNENQTYYEISTTRTETSDIAGGSYAALETFRIGSGVYPWSHSRRVNIGTDRNDITTVDIQGSIQGFGRTNTGPSGNIGLNNAVSGWLNHVKPALYADAAKFYSDLSLGNTLNSTAISQSATQSEFNGRVEYTAQFTDDPGDNLPSGIAERRVTYNRQDPVEVIAWHSIPFRALGDVKQNMGTPNRGTIAITAMARAKHTGNVQTDLNRAIARVETDINAVRPDPNTAEFAQIELDGFPALNYDPLTLVANGSVNYTFTLDLAGVNSSSGNISFSRYGGGL